MVSAKQLHSLLAVNSRAKYDTVFPESTYWVVAGLISDILPNRSPNVITMRLMNELERT